MNTIRQVVYWSHRTSRNFRPTVGGSAVGNEYEDRFRDTLSKEIAFDLISSRRDMGLGQGLDSRSGLAHELDLIASQRDDFFIFELKHYAEGLIDKEMVMVFNQKVLDFYLENYALLAQFRLHRIFITRSSQISEGIRRFCALWGILLIDNQMYSPPVCELILDQIKKNTDHRALPSWLQTTQLHDLKEQAAHLTRNMWRGLDELMSPQAVLPRGLFLDVEKLPPGYMTTEWINLQRYLSRQVSDLKKHYERSQQEVYNG